MIQLRYPRQILQDWLQSNGKQISDEQLEVVAQIFDAVFFASLGREEGTPTRLNVVFAPGGASELRELRDTSEDLPPDEQPGLAWIVLELAPAPLSVSELTKIAPAAEFGRSGIIVGLDSGVLQIQGIARRRRGTNGGPALVFSAVAAGSVVISQGREEVLRYEHGQLMSRAPSIFYKDGPVRQTLHAMFPAVTGGKPSSFFFPDQTIVHSILGLVKKMSSTGHGGIIAILPEGALPPDIAKYRFHDRENLKLAVSRVLEADAREFSTFWRFPDEGEPPPELRAEIEVARAESQRAWNELDELIEDLGQFTSVDNALLLAHDLTVIGAGYPINAATPPDVFEAHNEEGTSQSSFPLLRFGSRHRAAACFAASTKGALTFVASEDGPLRCMLWHNDQVLLWQIRLQELL